MEMWASPAGKVGQSGPTRADVEDFFFWEGRGGFRGCAEEQSHSQLKQNLYHLIFISRLAVGLGNSCVSLFPYFLLVFLANKECQQS
jgi:hypothetical protein